MDKGLLSSATKKPLREGFTTGTCATAGALAALLFLQHGRKPDRVSCPLPPFRDKGHEDLASPGDAFLLPTPRAWMKIAIEDVVSGIPPFLDATPLHGTRTATALVIKDGGDDPDVTHGAKIYTSLSLHGALHPERDQIEILGGKGVGRITLPGLPLPVGAPAINPVPRAQICYALKEAWRKYAPAPCPAMTVRISVPDGEALAKKTFNPRLGILGGISILGTQGTVKPFSNTAFMATISEELSLAKALGIDRIFLTTGRRSERLLMTCFPDAPEQAFVQVGDFCGHALNETRRLGFSSIVWGSFFGKLLKLAQGGSMTHAHTQDIDFRALADLCARHGASGSDAVASAKTAALALEYILRDNAGTDILRTILSLAKEAAQNFAGQKVSVHLFHLDGHELAHLP